MNPKWVVVHWLSIALAVLAWGALGVGVVSVIVSLVDSRMIRASDALLGLGVAAVRFVLLFSASQAFKLGLDIDASLASIGNRLNQLAISVGDLSAQQRKTSEQVRMVGSVVYEATRDE